MESVLKSLFKRELKAILAPYSDIICALFIILSKMWNSFNAPNSKSITIKKNLFRYITSNSKIYYYICSRWFCDFIYFTYSHWCYGRINIYLT